MKLFHVIFLSAACLLISEGSDLRIINGHEAEANSRPYMAYIKIQNRTHETICGGTLITEDWVLTAAHCTMLKGRATVILGAHLSGLYARERGRQILSVMQYVTYPKYNNKTYNNDIQLMKLSRTAKLGQKVKRFPIPTTFEDVDEGTVCETAGWGETEKKEDAKRLMEIYVSTITRKECQIRFKNEQTPDLEITENQICTSVGPGGEDTCVGDSGGPLICDGVFRGILSFGMNPCGQHNRAAAYTRLTEEYVDWIQEIIA
ncbi:mast cell protease 1A-like [Dendropsophus ebraccatus]|uniref:mast cell protease 1A-like n=1 Tax=Dendropsophus ebraccatus TaxID=150705 RepID=UPI0038321941